MTKKEIGLLKARITEELDNINRLTEELVSRGIISDLKCDEQKILVLSEDSFMLRAIGSIIHDFYVAVENLFELIGIEIDGAIPKGDNWHLQLIKQMTLEIEGIRPFFISRESMLKLDKYRAFRHVFRNVYGFNLDADRLKELLLDLNNTIELLTKDIGQFVKWLEDIKK